MITDVDFDTAVSIARVWLLQARRQRAVFGMFGLTALLMLYDLHYRVPAAPLAWWATLAFLTGLVPSLIGYDQYDRQRTSGTLRLMLLQGAPRWSIATGNIVGGAVVAVGAIVCFICYLLLSPGVQIAGELPRAVPALVLAAIAFLVFAHVLSLVIPKDGAAVMVLVLLVLGSSPPERWIPDGASVVVSGAIEVAWALVPTPIVLSRYLRGDTGLTAVALMVGQITIWSLTLVVLLGRRALLARKEAK